VFDNVAPCFAGDSRSLNDLSRCRPSRLIPFFSLSLSLSLSLCLFNRSECSKGEGTTAGQKSSRRVYLCDKSLPFVRRKCLGFRRHLRAVYSARFLRSSRVIRAKVWLTTRLLSGRRTKPGYTDREWLVGSGCPRQSQISKGYRVRPAFSVSLCLSLFLLVAPRCPTSNYKVARPTRAAGAMRARDLSRSHIAGIFSHRRRIWAEVDGDGRGNSLA